MQPRAVEDRWRRISRTDQQIDLGAVEQDRLSAAAGQIAPDRWSARLDSSRTTPTQSSS
jgi:hypothetical protein